MASNPGHGPRDYGAAIKALDTLQSNFAIINAIGQSGRSMNDMAIPEMQDWCRRIGYEPSDFDRLRPIHIAGTKGKGSTSAFISSILYQCSLPPSSGFPKKIGLYTSPHLRSVQERIQINNTPLSEQAFARYFFEVWDRLDASAEKSGPQNLSSITTDTPGPTKPAYFRYLTLMAFHAFLREGVDTAVIECGIGGEYDSTNIITSPFVSAVTNLGIDHTAILGETIQDIAWHKAGIFKSASKSRAVYTVSTQPESALTVLDTRAREQGLPLVCIERHHSLSQSTVTPQTLGLAADFQRTNASLAIAVAAAHLQTLGLQACPSGATIPHPGDPASTLPPEFARGLQTVQWSGRCETIRRGNIVWHLDGGHTMESIRLAAEWFGGCIAGSDAQPASTHPKRRRVLLFNQPTRDSVALARLLHGTLREMLPKEDGPLFDCAIFCTNTRFVDGERRGVEKLDVQRGLAEVWRELDAGSDVVVEGTVEEAVRGVERLQQQTDGEAAVFVTGSLHLVGGVLEMLEMR